jgi:hypothetical protein
MTTPESQTPIYDQLVREQEQRQCPPEPQDDTGSDQPAENPEAHAEWPQSEPPP